jgi:hypothetical protein
MVGKLRTSKSLQTFSRSFIAQAHHNFEKLPSDLKTQCLESGCMSILKAEQRFLAPYQFSDIHTPADIQEFGAIGESWGFKFNTEITFSD